MKRILTRSGAYACLALAMTALLLPFGISAWDSLHSGVPLQEQAWTLQYYALIQDRAGVVQALVNSVLVALGCTLLVVGSASLGAYAIHRFSPRGARGALAWVLSLRMFPLLLTLIPLSYLLKQAGIGGLWGVLLAQGAFILPFAFWLSWSYVRQIPLELFELAEVEGASVWSTLWHVAWPLAAPGIGLVAFYSFVGSWNDFLVASVVTQSLSDSTLPFKLANLMSEPSEPRLILAVNSVLMIPPLLFYWSMQRHFRSASPSLAQ